MQSQMMASVEDVEVALLALRSGYGLTALSLADQPTLMGFLRARSAVEGVEILHNVAANIDDTPQVIAAKYGFGLPSYAETTPRSDRIKSAKAKLGIGERSFYRWEKTGIRVFAHELIDHVSRDGLFAHELIDHELGSFHSDGRMIDEKVTLASVYEMILSLTESHQSVKNDVTAIKNSIDELYQSNGVSAQSGQRLAGEESKSDLERLVEQISTLSESVGVIHEAIIRQQRG